MAVQEKFNNLKSGPKEDKVAVASGVAIGVVIVLLVAWAIFFLRGIQRGSQQVQLGGGIQDKFNFQNVTDAQKQLQQEFGTPIQELQDLKSLQQGGNGQMQTEQMQIQGTETDQFGTGSSGN